MNKVLSLQTFQTLRVLFGSYKGYMALLIMLGVASGVLETFGIGIFIPLFSHILDKPIADTDTITNFFNWFFNLIHITPHLRFLLPLLIVVFIIRAIVLFTFEYIRAYLTTDYQYKTRSLVYRKLLQSSWSFLSAQRIGHTENAIMVDVGKVTKLLSTITNSILNVTSLAVYAAVAITISPEITVATLVSGGALLFLFRPFLERSYRYAKETVRVNKNITHAINENVIGFKSIKVMGRENAIAERVTKLFDYLRSLDLKKATVGAITTSAIQPAIVIFVVMVFLYSFLRPGFDLALFAVVLFLIQRIFLYVDRAQNGLHTFNDVVPHAGYVVDLLKKLETVREEKTGNATLARFEKELAFKDVSFSYQEGKGILHDVTFAVPQGSMFGIIGPSGVGKTTIVDMILKLFSPSSGRVLVDGVPLADIDTKDWRSRIGYVAQDIFLVDDSIFNNVRFFDASIGEGQVHEALGLAGLEGFIASLPKGIHSTVGERGVQLSAGQRQRIVLARALIRKPEILILDEATSALDGESERAIQEALMELRGKITIIVIAHRLSMVMETDRLAVIEGGTIVETGSPKTLLADEGSYFYRLTRLQGQEA